MPTFGAIEAFSNVPNEWDAYSERLDHFFTANDLGEIKLNSDGKNQNEVRAREDKRRAILLSVLGSATYNVLRNLCLPHKPDEKSYREILQLLKHHYSPIPSETVQRFKFNTRVQQSGEEIGNYIAALRKLAENCNYGDKLDEMLRDRLVLWGSC